MNSGDASTQPEPREEEFAALMAACDEALAAGIPPASICGSAAPAELQARAEEDLDCLRLLRQVWPLPGRTPTQSDGAKHQKVDSAPGAITSLGRFQIR